MQEKCIKLIQDPDKVFNDKPRFWRKEAGEQQHTERWSYELLSVSSSWLFCPNGP